MKTMSAVCATMWRSYFGKLPPVYLVWGLYDGKIKNTKKIICISERVISRCFLKWDLI